MKIIFICGSLEPGRDGVGDYTRRLAVELLRIDIEVNLIALNDRYITAIETATEQYYDKHLQVFRLPSSLEKKQRFLKAKEYIEAFDPDWLSLQFVIFSFHLKGLPFSLASDIYKLGKGRKWQLMFHELWLTGNKRYPDKYKIWGLVQKQIIRSVIFKIKPKIIYTQSSLYVRFLKTITSNVRQLPLFPNIPLPTETKILNEKKFIGLKEHQPLKLVIFGTIHPGAPIETFIQELASYAENNKQQVEVSFLGRCGAAMENWVGLCKQYNIAVKIEGEQTAEVVSTSLQKASFGISTSAYFMIEKSSVVATMLDHGLPVLCVSNKWRQNIVKSIRPIEGVFEYEKGNLETFISSSKFVSFENSVSKVAAKLLSDLSATSNS